MKWVSGLLTIIFPRFTVTYKVLLYGLEPIYCGAALLKCFASVESFSRIFYGVKRVHRYVAIYIATPSFILHCTVLGLETNNMPNVLKEQLSSNSRAPMLCLYG